MSKYQTVVKSHGDIDVEGPGREGDVFLRGLNAHLRQFAQFRFVFYLRVDRQHVVGLLLPQHLNVARRVRLVLFRRRLILPLGTKAALHLLSNLYINII
jgi:hypothetical protein